MEYRYDDPVGQMASWSGPQQVVPALQFIWVEPAPPEVFLVIVSQFMSSQRKLQLAGLPGLGHLDGQSDVGRVLPNPLTCIQIADALDGLDHGFQAVVTTFPTSIFCP